MPPRTPLGPKSANARVQKKDKTTGIELSPRKRSVIEGLHKAGCSIKSISEIEHTPRSTHASKASYFAPGPEHDWTKDSPQLVGVINGRANETLEEGE
ncbi:hypothetical protein FGG08_002258 [Glutinoglossum americanum]|uniref:Uncharacterized protein n=1 Tax=Glutinoglossum americanum TaxID=1670608 RepID=A0A9P8L4M2_9PEZI|nr:hypothetical protein FGG08_002258 [Glutinoglossum americanum]